MYHRTVSYGDLEAVAQLVQTEEEKNRIRQIANELAKETMRGNLAAYWWLPLDSISYTGLDAALENDAEKLYISVLAYGLPHPIESPLHSASHSQ
jgi:hypothetical protein